MYIGGHSLGGAMAADYVSSHDNEYKGLVLLAAYSTKEIHTKVLSIYGDNDQVLNKENYIKYKNNISDNEYLIRGGNHSYFGMYGIQKGDGTASISNERQLNITVDIICDWIDE